MPKLKKRYALLGLIAFLLAVSSISELIHKNEGKSVSIGSVRNGSIKNSYLIPYRGENYRYFSPFSYYILNNAYTHHLVAQTIVEAYQICESTCPNTDFMLMELSNKMGGKMIGHRTHQNGMSADFMVPKVNRKGKQASLSDHVGLFHYLLSFDKSGKRKPLKCSTIDFETVGRHILALDDAAQNNGLQIRKIILKIDLKDDFYATDSGKKVQARGIYLVQRLSHIVDILHDDHYHVDFELR